MRSILFEYPFKFEDRHLYSIVEFARFFLVKIGRFMNLDRDFLL